MEGIGSLVAELRRARSLADRGKALEVLSRACRALEFVSDGDGPQSAPTWTRLVAEAVALANALKAAFVLAPPLKIFALKWRSVNASTELTSSREVYGPNDHEKAVITAVDVHFLSLCAEGGLHSLAVDLIDRPTYFVQKDKKKEQTDMCMKYFLLSSVIYIALKRWKNADQSLRTYKSLHSRSAELPIEVELFTNYINHMLTSDRNVHASKLSMDCWKEPLAETMLPWWGLSSLLDEITEASYHRRLASIAKTHWRLTVADLAEEFRGLGGHEDPMSEEECIATLIKLSRKDLLRFSIDQAKGEVTLQEPHESLASISLAMKETYGEVRPALRVLQELQTRQRTSSAVDMHDTDEEDFPLEY